MYLERSIQSGMYSLMAFLCKFRSNSVYDRSKSCINGLRLMGKDIDIHHFERKKDGSSGRLSLLNPNCNTE